MSGQPILLAADRVITGDDPPALEDAAVLVEGGRITAVDRAAAFGSRMLSATRFAGASILPGIVDVHAHVTLAADRRPIVDVVADGVERAMARAAAHLVVNLEAGVTTMRDCASPGRTGVVLRDMVANGLLRGPRLLVSGTPVSQRGMHLAFMGGAADTVQEIRDRVASLADDGVDVIKVVASGGSSGGHPGRATYAVDQLEAAVEAAHERGLMVVAHCRAAAAVRNAALAGIDVIAHLEFLLDEPVTAMPGGAPTGQPTYDPEIGELVARSGAWLDLNPHSSGWDTLLALRSKRDRDGLDATGSAQLAELERYFEGMLHIISELRVLGLADRMAFGSDAAAFDTEFGHPSYELHLARLAGLSPLQSIQVVTRNAARACGLDDRGRIAPGLVADLVVAGGDPLADPDALDRLVAVYLGGTLVPHADHGRANGR